MKILIPIKRVNDYNVKVRPNQANTDVDLSNVKMAVNPFCEIALEEAIRFKDDQIRVLQEQNSHLLKTLDSTEEQANRVQLEKLAVEEENRTLR